MKNTIKITFALLITMLISSCSNDETTKDETYIYKSEKINFTEIVNNQIGNKSKSSTDSNSDDYIHSEFETSFYIPDNLSNSELEEYISDNQNQISGTLRYLINDGEFITIEIVNGQEISSSTSNKNIHFKRSYPCSYDGIQDCVQDAVDGWHVITKVICAFGAYACLGEEIAICIYDNC